MEAGKIQGRINILASLNFHVLKENESSKLKDEYEYYRPVVLISDVHIFQRENCKKYDHECNDFRRRSIIAKRQDPDSQNPESQCQDDHCSFCKLLWVCWDDQDKFDGFKCHKNSQASYLVVISILKQPKLQKDDVWDRFRDENDSWRFRVIFRETDHFEIEAEEIWDG